MEIPSEILETFNVFKPRYVLQPDGTSIVDLDRYRSFCDTARTKVALSKVSNKDKGNFVKVYYRKTRNKNIS